MPDIVSIKVYLKRGRQLIDIRRFIVEKGNATNMDYLCNKIRTVFPSIKNDKFSIYWQDADGDCVSIESQEELQEALNSYTEPLFKLHINLHRGIPEDGSSGGKPVHYNVICDGCEGSVIGFRYKCATCRNYDLCSACESKGMHKEHFMLRLPLPMHSIYNHPRMFRKFLYNQFKVNRRRGWYRAVEEFKEDVRGGIIPLDGHDAGVTDMYDLSALMDFMTDLGMMCVSGNEPTASAKVNPNTRAQEQSDQQPGETNSQQSAQQPEVQRPSRPRTQIDLRQVISVILDPFDMPDGKKKGKMTKLIMKDLKINKKGKCPGKVSKSIAEHFKSVNHPFAQNGSTAIFRAHIPGGPRPMIIPGVGGGLKHGHGPKHGCKHGHCPKHGHGLHHLLGHGPKHGHGPHFGCRKHGHPKHGHGLHLGGPKHGHGPHFGGPKHGHGPHLGGPKHGHGPHFGGPKHGHGPHLGGPKHGHGPHFGGPKHGHGPHLGGPKHGHGPHLGGPKHGHGPHFGGPKHGHGPHFGGPKHGNGPHFGGPKHGHGPHFGGHGPHFPHPYESQNQEQDSESSDDIEIVFEETTFEGENGLNSTYYDRAKVAVASPSSKHQQKSPANPTSQAEAQPTVPCQSNADAPSTSSKAVSFAPGTRTNNSPDSWTMLNRESPTGSLAVSDEDVNSADKPEARTANPQVKITPSAPPQDETTQIDDERQQVQEAVDNICSMGFDFENSVLRELLKREKYNIASVLAMFPGNSAKE